MTTCHWTLELTTCPQSGFRKLSSINLCITWIWIKFRLSDTTKMCLQVSYWWLSFFVSCQVAKQGLNVVLVARNKVIWLFVLNFSHCCSLWQTLSNLNLCLLYVSPLSLYLNLVALSITSSHLDNFPTETCCCFTQLDVQWTLFKADEHCS